MATNDIIDIFLKIDYALVFSGLSLFFSLLAFRGARRNELESKWIKSNQLASEAWDILGGEPGTFRLKEKPSKAKMVLAKRNIDEALTLFPKSTRANSALATYYMLAKDYKAASEVHEKLLRLNAGDATTLYNLGEVYRKLGDVGEAEKAYRKSIQWEPERGEAHHNLAHLFLYKGEYDEAIEEFKAAIELKPEVVESYHDLAVHYSETGEHKKSAEVLLGSLDKISDVDSKSLVYSLLGCQYMKIGEIGKAIDVLEAAVNLDPNLAAAHENLARAYHKKGRYAESKDEFSAARELEPQNVEHSYNLGQVYLKLGWKEEAINEFKSILKIEPLHPGIKEKIKFIQESA